MVAQPKESASFRLFTVTRSIFGDRCRVAVAVPALLAVFVVDLYLRAKSAIVAYFLCHFLKFHGHHKWRNSRLPKLLPKWSIAWPSPRLTSSTRLPPLNLPMKLMIAYFLCLKIRPISDSDSDGWMDRWRQKCTHRKPNWQYGRPSLGLYVGLSVGV